MLAAIIVSVAVVTPLTLAVLAVVAVPYCVTAERGSISAITDSMLIAREWTCRYSK